MLENFGIIFSPILWVINRFYVWHFCYFFYFRCKSLIGQLFIWQNIWRFFNKYVYFIKVYTTGGVSPIKNRCITHKWVVHQFSMYWFTPTMLVQYVLTLLLVIHLRTCTRFIHLVVVHPKVCSKVSTPSSDL